MGLVNRRRGLRCGGGTCHLVDTVLVYMCQDALAKMKEQYDQC